MSILTYFGYAIVLFILYRVALYFKWKMESKNHVPFIESWIPFVGSVVDFAAGPLKMLQKLSKVHETFSIHVLGKNMTFITNPKDYHYFFKATDEELSIMEAYQLMTPIFGKGLVYDAPNYGVMMEQLQFVVSGMNTNNFVRYAPKFQEETEKFIDSLPKTGKFNALKVLSEIIIATASRCLLGDEVRDLLSPEEFAKLYQDLDAGINPLTLFFPSLTWLPGAGARDRAKARVFQVFQTIINKRRSNPDVDHDDTLQLLINGKYKTGQPIPDDHICGILLGGLFAGEHTSSVTSTWTLFNILHNQKDFDRVIEEQKRVFDDAPSQDLSYDNIKKMKFLTMCMKEAVRINPPIVLLFRVLQKDKKLDDGKIIPKGNWVFVSPTYTHHLETIYKDAGNFHPERWELEKLEQEKFPFGNLSFGGGRHKCIGENFAQLQVTAILSVLFRKLKMKPCGALPVVNMAGLVIGPTQDNCMLEYEKL